MASTNETTNAPQQPLSLPLIQQHPTLPNAQKFRAISRNNSNTSTGSSTKGEFSSNLSTTNSVTSTRSQLVSRAHQLMATCGGASVSSTPIRSFQRATISSVVKTRAFDNNPVLKGLLSSASPSGQNSTSNSQTPSPLPTPIFSRSRSLRMSGGPRRYQPSPSHHFRTSSRTPETYSFNAGDSSMIMSPCSNETQAKLLELSSERSELKESLEFLECERQVLIDSARELRDILQRERSQSKREQEELKKQLTDSIAARLRAESQLTRLDVDTNDMRAQFKKLTDEVQSKDKQIESLRLLLQSVQRELSESQMLNAEIKKMVNEKLILTGALMTDGTLQVPSDGTSIVTEMARLRLELNEKDRLITAISNSSRANHKSDDEPSMDSNFRQKASYDIDILNKFLDQTVECIKSWPEELASSSHVQDLMKTLLSAYKPEHDELSLRLQTQMKLQ